MAKTKPNIWIDRYLWEGFKEYARRNNIDVSKAVEKLIEDALFMGIVHEYHVGSESQLMQELDAEYLGSGTGKPPEHVVSRRSPEE